MFTFFQIQQKMKFLVGPIQVSEVILSLRVNLMLKLVKIVVNNIISLTLKTRDDFCMKLEYFTLFGNIKLFLLDRYKEIV